MSNTNSNQHSSFYNVSFVNVNMRTVHLSLQLFTTCSARILFDFKCFEPWKFVSFEQSWVLLLLRLPMSVCCVCAICFECKFFVNHQHYFEILNFIRTHINDTNINCVKSPLKYANVKSSHSIFIDKSILWNALELIYEIRSFFCVVTVAIGDWSCGAVVMMTTMVSALNHVQSYWCLIFRCRYFVT